MSKKNYILLSTFLIAFSAWGQKINTDSLISLLKTNVPDTQKATVYLKLARAFYSIDENIAIPYADEGINLCKKINFEKGLYDLMKAKGDLLVLKSNYETAYRLYDSCIVFFKKMKDKKSEAMTDGAYAISYWLSGYFEKAYKYQYQALKINEERKDTFALGDSYNNGGLIFKDWAVATKNLTYLEKAMEYHLKALEYTDTINNKQRLSAIYNNIGIVFIEMARLKKDNSYLKEAENYLKRSLVIKKVLGNKRKIGINLNSLGSLYFDMEDYKKALDYFNQSYVIYAQIGDSASLSVACLNTGDCLNRMKENGKAIKFYNEGIEIARKTNNPGDLMSLYQNISGCYNDLKDFQKAFEFHVKYTSLKDSLITSENSSKLAEMSERFESEKKDLAILKKDAEIARQQLDAEKKSTQRNFLVGGLVFMGILAFFIFRGYRQKQKANTIITQQKHEVERQKELVDEKQKEILDSIYYARRIQRSLLTSEKYIARVLAKNIKK